MNEKVFAMVLKWHFQTEHKIAAIVTLVLARPEKKNEILFSGISHIFLTRSNASMNRKLVGSVALQPMSHNDRLFGTIHQGCQ